MTNKTIEVKTPYMALSHRIDKTFKLWLFTVLGGFILFLLMIIFGVIGHVTGLGTEINIENIGVAAVVLVSIYSIVYWGCLIASIVYQILMFLAFRRLKETEENVELKGCMGTLSTLLLVILALHIAGPMTMYLFGVVPVVIFVLNVVFFCKAKEFKNLIRR